MTILTKTMTPGRFLGLIQTDGSFGWFFDRRDRAFRPRIYLTTGASNKYVLLDIVRPWLTAQNVGTQYQEQTDKFGTSCNLYVERQKQVQRVIDIIDQTSSDYPTLLVDNKLVDYLALKHALRRVKEKQVGTRSEREAIFRELADLKMILLANNPRNTQEVLQKERSELELQLGITNSTGAAREIYNTLLQQANTLSDSLIKKLVENSVNCENCSETLTQFMAGIMDGDGSFQVGFNHTPEEKPTYTFEPMFTLTDGFVRTDRHYIFELTNQLFGNETAPQLVGEGRNAERLYIKSCAVLTKLSTFTRRAQLVIENRAERFQVMENVVLNYAEVCNNRDFDLKIVDDIEQFFNVEQRRYQPQECRRIINDYFSRK